MVLESDGTQVGDADDDDDDGEEEEDGESMMMMMMMVVTMMMNGLINVFNEAIIRTSPSPLFPKVEDGEYFQTLPENTIFILLRPGEAWGPAGEDIVSQGDDDDDDIYIMMKRLSVNKNHHFLLGVSCNHPLPPITMLSWFSQLQIDFPVPVPGYFFVVFHGS